MKKLKMMTPQQLRQRKQKQASWFTIQSRHTLKTEDKPTKTNLHSPFADLQSNSSISAQKSSPPDESPPPPSTPSFPPPTELPTRQQVSHGQQTQVQRPRCAEKREKGEEELAEDTTGKLINDSITNGFH